MLNERVHQLARHVHDINARERCGKQREEAGTVDVKLKTGTRLADAMFKTAWEATSVIQQS